MTQTSYAKLTTWLLGAWFTFSLVASAAHLFQTGADQPPLPLLLAVLVPIAAFAIWYSNSSSFRDYVLGLNPRILTILQAWRLGGFVFLVLYTYHILPGMFALPAGWGDIAIGATAIFAATKLTSPRHRTSFILWQLLGMTDLVTAITLGAATRFLAPDAVSTEPMTMLPLSLIPTFVVPLLLIVHIVCIAQARRWRGEQDVPIGAPTGSFAV